VIRLLPDPKERAVSAVAGALGLQVVGWIFTRKPQAAGEPPLLPHELYAMAAMQVRALLHSLLI
jgi:hypothetical protein